MCLGTCINNLPNFCLIGISIDCDGIGDEKRDLDKVRGVYTSKYLRRVELLRVSPVH